MSSLPEVPFLEKYEQQVCRAQRIHSVSNSRAQKIHPDDYENATSPYSRLRRHYALIGHIYWLRLWGLNRLVFIQDVCPDSHLIQIFKQPPHRDEWSDPFVLSQKYPSFKPASFEDASVIKMLPSPFRHVSVAAATDTSKTIGMRLTSTRPRLSERDCHDLSSILFEYK